MSLSDEITAAALTPAATPPIIPRRVTFDKVMKCPLCKKRRLEWLSDQVPTRFKRLNGLCRGAAGCRLKFRQCRRGPRERVGTGEEAERHPLGRTEFAVIALSLYEPSHLQQELCRFAR